jgi:hypothetical protein
VTHGVRHPRIVASFVALWDGYSQNEETFRGPKTGVSVSSVTDNLTAAILSRRFGIVKLFFRTYELKVDQSVDLRVENRFTKSVTDN